MYYVYIILCEKWKKLGNEKIFDKNIYYTGMTSDPKRRLWEHKNGVKSNWMNNNNIRPLCFVYIENMRSDYYKCLRREKKIKQMNKIKKLKLINEYNEK